MSCKKNCLLITVLVGVLAWFMRVYPWQWWIREYSMVPPVSYDGRIRFDLSKLKTPFTEEQIVEIVKDAHQNNRGIRVLADGHSWSEISQTQDIMISLANYSGILSIDKDKMEATFKAGTPLSNVSLELDKRGFAMIQLGSVAVQSIAGAISTGTHGSGITIGNLASLVTSLKLVSGTGEVHVLSETDDNTDDFRAAQVSIGLLGVVTEVTVRVKNKFHLEENRTHHTLTECLKDLDELVHKSGYQYFKMWVEFYNDYCIRFQTRETDKPITGRPPRFISFLTYYIFEISTRITYTFPSLTPYVMWLADHVGFDVDTYRVDNSYLILNDHFELPIHQEGEVIVDYQYCVQAVEAIRKVILEERHPVNYITEVRFIKGDEIWMSPSHGMSSGSCAVTLTIYAPPNTVNKYFTSVYNATKVFKARYHWGKHFTANRAVIEDLYPKFKDFAVIRKKYDPKGVFISRFIHRTFDFSKD